MYINEVPIPDICWQGRWTQQRTLEFYLQEVAAQVPLSKLEPRARATIQELDALFDTVLDMTVPADFTL